MVVELQPHPIADVFPLLRGEEYEKFLRDIKTNGVQIAITLYQGMILDGRNRYIACCQLGIECPVVEYTGSDPWGYVISLNVQRRSLTKGATALAAAQAANLGQGART